MGVEAEYLDMPVRIADLERESLAFYGHCANHDFRLQHCAPCDLLRYPPTTACPWCANPEATWRSVEPKGTLYSYGEVHHAIQPSFRAHTPYLLLLVELDAQKGSPTEHEALRVMGNLADADGNLAAPEVVRSVGIGSRLKMVFRDVGPGLAMPLWTLDDAADQPASPWRYPQE